MNTRGCRESTRLEIHPQDSTAGMTFMERSNYSRRLFRQFMVDGDQLHHSPGVDKSRLWSQSFHWKDTRLHQITHGVSCNFMDRDLSCLNKALHFLQQTLTRWKLPPHPTQVGVTALRAHRHPKPAAKSAKTTQVEMADEVVGALHRNTWHVMLSQFMRCDKEVIQTACGRHFEVSKLLAVQELQLSGTQSLCGHSGCRKGWTSVGA